MNRGRFLETRGTTELGAAARIELPDLARAAPGVRRFYPLGYPVDFTANSERALEAASKLWGSWPMIFDCPVLSIDIQIHPGPRPTGVQRFEARAGFLRFSCDESNVAEFDVARRAGRLSAGSEALDDELCFRHHWLETLVLTALDSVFFTPLHAACIAANGSGTLLCGDSGAGKSTLAYACARGGWTLVSDDAVHLAPGPGRVGVGGSNKIRLREGSRALFPEISARQAIRAPNGKRTIEIDCSDLGFRTARHARIDRCVFLERRRGPVRVNSLPVRDAIHYFLKYLHPRETARAERHLREVLKHDPMLLKYEHVDDAREALA